MAQDVYSSSTGSEEVFSSNRLPVKKSQGRFIPKWSEHVKPPITSFSDSKTDADLRLRTPNSDSEDLEKLSCREHMCDFILKLVIPDA